MYEPQSDFQDWCNANFRQLVVSHDIRRLLAQAFEGGRVAEREACAKAAEQWGRDIRVETWDVAGKDCAAAIRARSQE
jgi:hypothetical protein